MSLASERDPEFRQIYRILTPTLLLRLLSTMLRTYQTYIDATRGTPFRDKRDRTTVITSTAFDSPSSLLGSIGRNTHGKIVIDGRNDGAHKLEKDEQIQFNGRLLIVLGRVNEIADNRFHNPAVLAGMDACVGTGKKGVRFHSDSLVGVICHDIFHGLLRCQWLSRG